MKLTRRKIAVALVVCVLATTATVAVTAAPAAAGTTTRSVSVYRSSFSPGWSYNASGVQLQFVNRDSVAHHIVAYVTPSTVSWSLDIWLQPGQTYTTQTFNVTYKTVKFRDADRSTIIKGYGYEYCSGMCGSVQVMS